MNSVNEPLDRPQVVPHRITNCHAHTFTHEHSPDRFVPWPIVPLTNFRPFRRLFIALAHIGSKKRGKLARYAEIVETSYAVGQAGVFDKLQGSYPEGTRFVVLPMDMTFLNAGRLEKSIDEQHDELADLRDHHPDVVIPFAAVDPRHGEAVVAKTIRLLEKKQFRGIKLYPPTGYHPNNPVLWPLYDYAEKHGVPVLTHCSRPASVQYRGTPTAEMLADPAGGDPFPNDRFELLTRFTDPDAYLPILERHPQLRVCLAHFGGAGDWDSFLKHPWESQETENWLTKILKMIRSGRYANLWTDIAYTLFADDEYAYLLKVILSDDRILSRTLFGSDFYVVESALLEERRRAVHIRAVLGEDVFRKIAGTNPAEFLGEP
jgi:predicted TIM-barrel fold metal-dependent hydrolase